MYLSNHGVVAISRHIAFALLHRGLITLRYLVHYPSRYVFGSRIERQQFIEITMVKISVNFLFDMRKIRYHTVGVKALCTAIYCYYPIVTMQTGAFAVIGQFEPVRPCNLHSFRYVIHKQSR